MSDKENSCLESDAAPVNVSNIVAKRTNSNDNDVAYRENSAIVNNNTIVNNQASASTFINIENSNGIHFGNVVTINLPPQSSTSQNRPGVQNTRPPLNRGQLCQVKLQKQKEMFRATETVEEMIKSQEELNEVLLYMFCQNFGRRHEEIVILLNIDKLLYERLYADNVNIYGTGEVCDLFRKKCLD
jgi:hypothetical protein